MSGRERRPPRGGPPIDDDEALWQSVARSTDRLKAKSRVGTHAPPTAVPAERQPPPPPAKRKASASAKPQPPVAPSSKSSRPAPLAEVGRRTVRQISSGKIEIDAKLDLHGATQREAKSRLRGFLLDAQARGLRTVLVVTGKGVDAGSGDRLGRLLGEPQRGVLRQHVPLWLQEADLRSVVLSFTTAGVRHGGEGALYVQLRAPRGRGEVQDGFSIGSGPRNGRVAHFAAPLKCSKHACPCSNMFRQLAKSPSSAPQGSRGRRAMASSQTRSGASSKTSAASAGTTCQSSRASSPSSWPGAQPA